MKTQNRLPDCDSDSDLANRFANYFIEKVDRIRANFNNISTLQATNEE